MTTLTTSSSTYTVDSLLDTFDVRELTQKDEIIEHLRLRYAIFKDTYGVDDKKGGLDVDPYDWNSHLIGVFHEGRQIAAIRVVKRRLVAHTARILDEIVAQGELPVQRHSEALLPSETVFSYRPTTSTDYRKPPVELSRLCVLTPYRHTGVYYLAFLSAIGLAFADGIDYFLYSCPSQALGRYERITPTCCQLDQRPDKEGFPGFKFTLPSSAVVASIIDAPADVVRQALLGAVRCRAGRTMTIYRPSLEIGSPYGLELAA
jgi:hypothetical protein